MENKVYKIRNYNTETKTWSERETTDVLDYLNFTTWFTDCGGGKYIGIVPEYLTEYRTVLLKQIDLNLKSDPDFYKEGLEPYTVEQFKKAITDDRFVNMLGAYSIEVVDPQGIFPDETDSKLLELL